MFLIIAEPGFTYFKISKPPTIEIDAPEIASEYYTTVTVRVSDDVELGWLNTKLLSPGTTTYEETEKVGIPLDSPESLRLYAVTDTSGNMAKAEVRIASPEIPLALGTYDSVGTVTIPDGFDCLVPGVNPIAHIEGLALYELYVYSPSSIFTECLWSVEEGYCVGFQMRIEDGSSLAVSTSERFPLEATSFLFETASSSGSGSWGYFEKRFTATFVVTESAPPTIEANISMRCNINDGGWFNGAPLNFSAQLIE